MTPFEALKIYLTRFNLYVKISSMRKLIDNRPYQLLLGRAEPAPCVSISVCGRKFEAKIDTGADVTVIPSEICENIQILGRRLIIGGYSGAASRTVTRLTNIRIFSYPEGFYEDFYPRRGVIPGDNSFGFIGLDILKHFRIELNGPEGLLTIYLNPEC